MAADHHIPVDGTVDSSWVGVSSALQAGSARVKSMAKTYKEIENQEIEIKRLSQTETILSAQTQYEAQLSPKVATPTIEKTIKFPPVRQEELTGEKESKAQIEVETAALQATKKDPGHQTTDDQHPSLKHETHDEKDHPQESKVAEITDEEEKIASGTDQHDKKANNKAEKSKQKKSIFGHMVFEQTKTISKASFD